MRRTQASSTSSYRGDEVGGMVPVERKISEDASVQLLYELLVLQEPPSLGNIPENLFVCFQNCKCEPSRSIYMMMPSSKVGSPMEAFLHLVPALP